MLALTLEAPQPLDPVEPVVAVGIADPIEPRLVRVRDDIEAVEREEEPLGIADVQVDRLDADLGRRTAVPGERHPVELARLCRGDETALGVARQADPGALLLPHRVDQFGPEPIRELEAFGRRGPSRPVVDVPEEATRLEPADGPPLPVVAGAAAGRPPLGGRRNEP